MSNFNVLSKSISRVLYLTIIYLRLLLPITSSDLPPDGDEQPPFYSPTWSCSRWGLQSHIVAYMLVSSYLTFPSLPDKQAVYFCCTFLEVTFTGYYPAPCSVELGLSSCIACDHLIYSLLILYYISPLINIKYYSFHLIYLSLISNKQKWRFTCFRQNYSNIIIFLLTSGNQNI